jgi:osmoprotectant transport system ATP-binding protein
VAEPSPAAGKTVISLVNLTKAYPGSAPVVENLNLDVGRGEIMVFVGPSGCGKTTIMRLINRMIEPTGGKIFVNGRNALEANVDELRRSIGYVIQEIGLLPHMSVGKNVALVPKALKWDKQRIRARVDELLELVGLPPDTFRDRLPKQLSGGQQQRVGVARALAADPPILLMDEPFGAIDPIVRDRLQDEFLRLQEQIQKTVVFITHDIQEAVKMGDRIAVFADGGRLAQLDTPANVLTRPADDFVRSFIGGGAAVRLLGLVRVDSLPAEPGEPDGLPVVAGSDTLHHALDLMLRYRARAVAVTDDSGRHGGVLRWESILTRASDLGTARPSTPVGADGSAL